jgi:hypothetical protein
MRYRKLHLTTDNMHRIIDIRVLTKAGAFKRPMRFPFQRIEVTARDHVRLYPMQPASEKHAPRRVQIIRITWAQMTFGMKPYFICSRCNKRRVFLYFDGLQAYCRCCAGAWYWCQRKHHRTRLLHWSHKLRVRLGDQFGKPGDQYPPRPYRQKRTTYRRAIIKLRTIERRYMHIIGHDRRYQPRDRDELGRYVPREPSTNTEDLGEER